MDLYRSSRWCARPFCRCFLLHRQHTIVHCIIGLKILTALVSEMNHQTERRIITQHRKVAVSFRDMCLLRCFEISLTILNQVSLVLFRGVSCK